MERKTEAPKSGLSSVGTLNSPGALDVARLIVMNFSGVITQTRKGGEDLSLWRNAELLSLLIDPLFFVKFVSRQREAGKDVVIITMGLKEPILIVTRRAFEARGLTSPFTEENVVSYSDLSPEEKAASRFLLEESKTTARWITSYRPLVDHVYKTRGKGLARNQLLWITAQDSRSEDVTRAVQTGGYNVWVVPEYDERGRVSGFTQEWLASLEPPESKEPVRVSDCEAEGLFLSLGSNRELTCAASNWISASPPEAWAVAYVRGDTKSLKEMDERQWTTVQRILDIFAIRRTDAPPRTAENLSWLYRWVGPFCVAKSLRSFQTCTGIFEFLRTNWPNRDFLPFASRAESDRLVSSTPDKNVFRLSSSAPGGIVWVHSQGGDINHVLFFIDAYGKIIDGEQKHRFLEDIIDSRKPKKPSEFISLSSRRPRVETAKRASYSRSQKATGGRQVRGRGTSRAVSPTTLGPAYNTRSKTRRAVKRRI